MAADRTFGNPVVIHDSWQNALLAHVWCWLKADIQSAENEVCLYPNMRYFWQGWECLKVTACAHSDQSAAHAKKAPVINRGVMSQM
jgi:hypothetical protein